MKLLLIRHPPAAIAPGICYGRRDLALADEGDAEAVAEEVARHEVRLVWSSPATRCLVPARMAAARANAALRIDARLQELDFGAWEGMRWDDVPRASLDDWATDPQGFAPPGGENGAALLARIGAFWCDLGDADCAVITHGGPLRILHALARGDAPDLLAPAPACGAVIVLSVMR
jgi:alpha-ribazole phosphatase